MKKTIHIIFTVFILFFVTTEIFGQARVLRYADKQLGLENYSKALSAYQEAFERRPVYETALQVANTYNKLGMYEESLEWWEKVIQFEASSKSDFSAYLRSQIQNGNWEKVDSLITESGYSSFDFPELHIDEIKGLFERGNRVKLVSLENINTPDSEFGVSKDKDGNIYFSSDRGSVGDPGSRPSIRLDAKNNIFSKEKSSFNEREFYQIYKSDESGQTALVVTDLLEALHINDPSLLQEKNMVFYTAFVGKTKIKGGQDFSNHAGIYFGQIDENGNITSSLPLPFNDHQAYGVMNPFVDWEARRLYFASDMPGGHGGYDIYYSEFDDDLNFQSPVNLGPEVNTEENESHPSRSGAYFYFSSRGHVGLGGMDVFKADYQDGNVSNVTNMGAPYNSVRDDFSFVVTGDGKRYISSDREGGKGLDDIYTIEDLFKMLIAQVRDCDGDLIEDFEANLQTIEGGNTETTIPSAGMFTAELDPEGEFVLRLSKKGYFPVTDGNISAIGFEGDTIRKEYVLAAIPYKTPIFVDIVYYDLDKSFIRKDAASTLDKVGELMAKYNFVDLIVSSHTDSRASNAYNEALSKRRADAVRDYLEQYDVERGRVHLEWHGETQLVNDCGDGVPCPEADHQLNRRSELILEAFSDTERDYELPEGIEDPCELPAYLQKITEEAGLPIIYFDFDKSNIRQVHRKELERVSVMLNRKTDLKLYIEGHTDQRGSDAYNMGLSERRAKVVMDYLIKRGIEENRMEYKWFGKTRPVNICETGDCNETQHQQNRRTELRVSSK